MGGGEGEREGGRGGREGGREGQEGERGGRREKQEEGGSYMFSAFYS